MGPILKMSACPLLWTREPQNSHWQFLCEDHRLASGRIFSTCDYFNNRSMEVCIHQGFSNVIVGTREKRAFSGPGFEEDWFLAHVKLSSTEHLAGIETRRMHDGRELWPQGAVGSAKFVTSQYPQGRLGVHSASVSWISRLPAEASSKIKGGEWGEWPFNSVLGLSWHCGLENERKKHLSEM